MAAKLIIFACVVLASQAALVRRDAPATTPLQDLEKHGGEFVKTFTEQLNAVANSKNTQQVQKSLKEGTDSVLEQLNKLSTALQGAIADANGKAKEALETTRANIQKTAEQLRKEHPEVEQQTKQLGERLQAAVKEAVGHTTTLAKEVAAGAESAGKQLEPKIKDAYDAFVKQTQEVQKKLHEAAAAKQ